MAYENCSKDLKIVSTLPVKGLCDNHDLIFTKIGVLKKSNLNSNLKDKM